MPNGYGTAVMDDLPQNDAMSSIPNAMAVAHAQYIAQGYGSSRYDVFEGWISFVR